MELAELAKEKTFRNDVDFSNFQNDFNASSYFSFNDLFLIKENNCVDISNFEDDFYYSEIGNVSKDGEVEPVKLNFNERTIEDEDYYKKIEKGDIIKVEENDILISKVRPNLKKYVLIDQSNKDYFYTSAFIHLQPKKLNKILYYALRTIFYNNLIAISRQGKGYPTLKKDDFQYLKFDKSLVNKLSQNPQITKQIEQIEQKIKELKSQTQPAQTIINKIFARKFGFDENLYNELGKGMTAGTQMAEDRKLRVFETDFSELSNSRIVRFSCRFHNPPTKKLMNLLNSIDTLTIKDVVDSYEKGVQPKYNLDGEIPVVKIANLKNGFIDFSETEFITQEDFDKFDNNKKLKINDIIICGTGKISLGKIDFLEEEKDTITTVDNIILRLKNNYNSLFFIYFFRCILGYFQIERDYTGATNQIHLYWEQIQNFQIPDIPLDRQQQIVSEIKAELDEQEKVKKTIAEERNKIDEIIENSIRDNSL